MGRGTRHSKSCQIKPYFTYDERNSRSNVYQGLGTTRIALDESTGTMKVRVGSDSQKPYDACWLCNQRAVQPVVTNRGLLYCRTCIIENMGEQKKEYKRKLEEYEHQQAQKEEKQVTTEAVKGALKEAAARSVEEAILPTEGSRIAAEITSREAKIQKEAESEGRKEQTMNSFWVAHNAPEWTKKDLEKPDPTVRCPFTKKPLKLKQLREVRWKSIPDGKGYMCPISNVTFKNGVDIVILPGGQPCAKKALQKVWGKADAPTMVCPLTGQTILKSELVDLAKSGTGFAASTAGAELSSTQAEQYRHSLTMAIS